MIFPILIILIAVQLYAVRHVRVMDRPKQIDSRCFDEHGHFDPNLGDDDLDCGNL